ncbi:uncharacterized protein C16orf96 homolog [Ornithorhynchus anatinus]|uniref:uncharacterized protein C16orf96 homolog n=1 Tax=Ornithorhynchus anatinus TaxID=9258 RepID=UPI0010A775CB|nr:uncharacterized protein C16orf96 homolog [Ornithorhynchus anatinus]
MSSSITYAELLKWAIGTPEKGAVNFNALYLLLQSILDHLHLGELRRELSGDERDHLEPVQGPPPSAESGPGAARDGPVQPLAFLLDLVQERLARMEGRLAHLDGLPGSGQLLEASHGSGKPVQEMWQMMQLKKKVEGNEEGMTKAMNTLQDLLTNICFLQTSVDTFLKELQNLKEKFGKLNLELMSNRVKELELQREQIQELREDMDKVQMKLDTFPEHSDVVQWTSLHDAMEELVPETVPQKLVSVEEKQLSAKQSLSSLAHLPSQHDLLREQLVYLEGQLKDQAIKLAQLGISDQVEEELSKLRNRLSDLEKAELKDEEFGKKLGNKVQKLKEQCVLLGKASERLQESMEEIQSLRSLVEQLELNKVDKALMLQEMKEKADKSALACKANRADLESASGQLSEMMQELLQKMTFQEEDWQKVLDKLFSDMDSKLDRMELDPLKKELELVWKFIKKHLSEGPRFDADSAAGFKKQLFERVKCISCNRPVEMMTGPHMITVRKASLTPRPRPASANGYEYLFQRQQTREPPPPPTPGMEMGSVPEGSERPTQDPPNTQQTWSCSHGSSLKRATSKGQCLSTLYPYGDPSVLDYDHAEVDILGVDGILYKGRMSARNSVRSASLEKDLPGMKILHRLPRNGSERVRSATSFNAAVRSRTSSGIQQQLPPSQQPSATPEPMNASFHVIPSPQPSEEATGT